MIGFLVIKVGAFSIIAITVFLTAVLLLLLLIRRNLYQTSFFKSETVARIRRKLGDEFRTDISAPKRYLGC
jgi:hypothetical protein